MCAKFPRSDGKAIGKVTKILHKAGPPREFTAVVDVDIANNICVDDPMMKGVKVSCRAQKEIKKKDFFFV